ncbi:SagB family peptide dehydrogenase [Ruegeria sp.]|uniref:SagB family peptide dehydrogenase n=1 Tax=Ruegeria sp. TaxID=1879320 RepID=UPI00231149DC|nr:SagB family peptide dehydrogenase [Ruegeria sp.]MDA7965156.1 SagB family peptide dehydrogenase [Ruegeria sp.]
MEPAEIWAYGLAPDILFESDEQGVCLKSPAETIRFSAASDVTLVRKLRQGRVSETALSACLAPDVDAPNVCASFLFRLDKHGFLTRFLMQGSQVIAACIPQRAPPGARPDIDPGKPFRLSSQMLLQPRKQGLRAQVPGSWAVLDLLDPRLGSLLFGACDNTEDPQSPTCVPGLEPPVLAALIGLFDWCGLTKDSSDQDHPKHDALFHSHTRLGFRRAQLGKTGRQAPSVPHPIGISSIPLPLPDMAKLIASDPPHAQVSRQRRSRRVQGAEPISHAQLGELLFRCFYQDNGRRTYPSGGGVYPLTAYLIVNRCDGLKQGLYTYDTLHHGLTMIAEFNSALKSLLKDASAAANCASQTQVLLVFSADMMAMRTAYGDLAYSLVLKEVGAVYQNVQLAGEAMRLATCPLGTGNSVTFAQASGLDIDHAPSVGEMCIGSLG